MEWNGFAALSLNPALDITMWMDGLEREYNQVLREQYEAAGKAVNVARVLGSYGVPCKTLIVTGDKNRRKYLERLEQDGIDYDTVLVEGEIRENISLVLPDDKLIRLARPGCTVTREHLVEIEKCLAAMELRGKMVVVAGKNPQGLLPEQFVELCGYIRGLGGSLAVDTSSLKEQEICALTPWMIKPNLEELEQMTGETLDTREKLLATLARFHQNGVEHILLSLGGEGLLYSGKGKTLTATVPQVRVKSTVGAGDSTLSGFLLAYCAGKKLETCVRVAASFGTAKVLLDGTNPPRREDVAEIYPQVTLQEI